MRERVCLHDDAVDFRTEPATVEIGRCPRCGEDTEWEYHRAAPPSDPAAPLDVERLARAMSKVAYPDPEDAWPNTVKDVKDLYRHQAAAIAAAIAREYAALATPKEADCE